jgi:hypothetical protein
MPFFLSKLQIVSCAGMPLKLQSPQATYSNKKDENSQTFVLIKARSWIAFTANHSFSNS